MIQKVESNGKVQYRYRVYYTDSYGKRKQYNSKLYDRKKDCQHDEAVFVARNGTRCTITFYDCAMAYAESKKDRVKYRTFRDIQMFINVKFKHWHKAKMTDITSAEIIRYFDKLNYATETKGKIFNTLNSIFKYAKLHFKLKENPMDVIPRFQKTEEEIIKKLDYDQRIWVPEEFIRVEEQIPDRYWQYRILLHLLYWTGMRKNEAMSLTWKDIDLKKGFLHIWRQYELETFQWKTLKTKNSRRNIRLDKETINQLQLLRNYYSNKYETFDESWFAFGGLKPLSTTQLDRIKNKAEQAAGVKHIRVHDLRHSHASYLIANGVNIVKVSRRLGHSSISMTVDTYTHLLEDSEDDIINSINQKNQDLNKT